LFDRAIVKKAMDHSKQHWIPSSYLEAWCDPDVQPGYEPYVWRMPKKGGEGRRKAPRKIFAEADFYTIRLPDGRRDLRLEHGLGTLEDKFCQIRDTRVARREPLSREEKVWFCAFIAAMHFRTRAQRNAFHQQWGHALDVAEDLQRTLATMTPEQLQRLRPPRSLDRTRGQSLTIDEVKKLAKEPIQRMLPSIIEEDLPVLTRMNLSILTTEDDIGFITSDHPCVRFIPGGGRRPPMLHASKIEVTMPISPKSLALLCWADVPEYEKGTPAELDNANRLRQVASDEYFIVRRNATKPVWFT
jgi:Protein of unknown function (DUF4238)